MDLSTIINHPTATLVDVREAYEFKAGHAPGAIHIPLNEIFQRLQEFQAMSAPIVVYCRSGNRSEHARLVLQAKGLKSVFNGGGLDDVRYYQSQAAKDSSTNLHHTTIQHV